MLKFSNLKMSRLGILLFSSLLLSGCGNSKTSTTNTKDYHENGVNAYVFENGDLSCLMVQELEGINAKTYRDLMGLVLNDVDVLKLISPQDFDLNFLDDLEVNHLELITPEEDFNFNGVDVLNGLDSILIAVGNDTDLNKLIKYIKKSDLSNIDLTIKINDPDLSLKFANILKNNTIKANSITLEISSSKCLDYLYNLKSSSIKVSFLVNDDCDMKLNFQINKKVDNFILEFVAIDRNTKVNLSELIIKSHNDKVNVDIDKTSNINLIIPEDIVLNCPDGTLINIEKENILNLNRN